MRRIIALAILVGFLPIGATVAVSARATLLAYPYLGETTTNSAVISWATDSAGASEVRYSLDQSYSNVATASTGIYDGKYWYSATITGLMTDTTYYYKVYTSGADLTPWPEITFTTAPGPTATAFTFVALGDSRPLDHRSGPTPEAVRIAARMAERSFDLAIHTGDIVHSGGTCSGVDSSWNQYLLAYFDLYRQSIGDTPFYPSVGSHELEGGDCGYRAYRSVFYLPENVPSGGEEQYYSFDWGNAHYVALDTNQAYGPGSAQYNWLVSDLQSNTLPWQFVFFHDPAYSSCTVHGSTPPVQSYLVPLFETYGVDVVFNGHDHDYERTCPILNNSCTTPADGGVVYYVTGGGGGGLYEPQGDWFTAFAGSLYHFMEVTVHDCWLRLDTVDQDGNVYDSYEIDQCAGRDVFLTIATEGEGAIEHTPGNPYTYGQVATLRPVPAVGWSFAGWGGANAADLVGKGDGSWLLTMNANKEVTATFANNKPKWYLPFMPNRWPPIPDPPVLDGINNADQDDYHTVGMGCCG